jgi:hypothetical protein
MATTARPTKPPPHNPIVGQADVGRPTPAPAPAIATSTEAMVSAGSSVTGTPGRWPSMATKCVAQIEARAVTAVRKHQSSHVRPVASIARRQSCSVTVDPARHVTAASPTSQRLCSTKMQVTTRMGFPDNGHPMIAAGHSLLGRS